MKISGIAGILAIATAVAGAAIPKPAVVDADVNANVDVKRAVVDADVNANVDVLKRDLADIDAKIRANVLNILGLDANAKVDA